MTLTERQHAILALVAQEYIRGGVPVSSRAVAEKVGFKISPSTVRNEFAVLEEKGYITSPHTSAGRVPTDLGYRDFVDWILRNRPALEAPNPPVPVGELAREVDKAVQQTSEVMAQATNLLALVIAPRSSGDQLRHIELLPLQPNLVMIVFILSTGRVSKRIIDFPTAVDPGMVEWARSYLNELMADHLLSERLVRSVLENRELSASERSFLLKFQPAFEDLLGESADSLSDALYIGGASHLLSESHFENVSDLRQLLGLLEQRYALLRVLRSALNANEVLVRIGGENEDESLHRFSLVAARYGLPHRALGAVSVIGPLRMDYETAILTVRGTAQLLSDFLEDRFE
ncbi:MAG: heat-inducible transcriptional repressor HrcA [Thermoleophilia bacterium]